MVPDTARCDLRRKKVAAKGLEECVSSSSITCSRGNEQFANSRHRPRLTRGAPNDYDSTAALPAGVTESQPPRFKLPILVG